MKPAVWNAFLSDTLRLCDEAERALDSLFSTRKRATAEQVDAFFSVLHTLKGTCSMVRGCEGIASLLHDLEARLATRSAQDSAADRGWVAGAQATVLKTRTHIERLKRRRTAQGAEPGNKTTANEEVGHRGWLVRLPHSRETLVWIAEKALIQVLEASRLEGRREIPWRGSWIPVLMPGEVTTRLALLVESARGVCVLPVAEIVGASTLAEAVRRGAEVDPIEPAEPASAVAITSEPEAESPAA